MVYDELGRPKTRTLIGSDPLTYIYDDLSRLVSIASGTTTYTYAYENQISPLIQSLTRPDQSVTGYTYDSLKRLTQIANKKSNQDIINQYNYSFNHPDFQLDQRSDELVSGVSIVKLLQNETLSYENNNLNQLTQISTLGSPPSALSLAYDFNGNMTKGYTPQGYEFIAAYDAENRLKNLEYTDNQAKVRATVYTYRADSFLVKIEKFENHVKMTEVNFVGEGFLPIQERDGNNNVIREYTWGQNMGGGIGGLLNMRQQGQDYSYLYDGKGNVTVVLDSSQNTVATYTYDEFGKVVSKTGTLDQPFQFSTKYYDQQTGLNYYGYRFYSPVLGRWINRDPLGEDGGINLYEFVGNNAVTNIDPKGLECQLLLKYPSGFSSNSRIIWGNWGSWGLTSANTTEPHFPAFWGVTTCICMRHRSGVQISTKWMKWRYLYMCVDDCQVGFQEYESGWEMISNKLKRVNKCDTKMLSGGIHMNESAGEFTCEEKCNELNQE